MGNSAHVVKGIAVLLAIGVLPARGEIIGSTGAVVIVDPPADARVNELESDTEIFVFVENLDMVAPDNIPLNIENAGILTDTDAQSLSPSRVDAGTMVSSYFVHFDRIGRTEEYISAEGSLTFDEEVRGLIVLSHSLEASHAMVGVPTTLYSNNPVELDTPGQYLSISDDRRTVSFKIFVNLVADDIRIITSPVSIDDPDGGTDDPDDPDGSNGGSDGTDGTDGTDDTGGSGGGITDLIDALIPDGGINGEAMCGACGSAGAPAGIALVATMALWQSRRRRRK